MPGPRKKRFREAHALPLICRRSTMDITVISSHSGYSNSSIRPWVWSSASPHLVFTSVTALV